MTNTTKTTRAPKTITVTEIRSKDRKRFGVVYPGELAADATADIIPGVSVRLYGEQYKGQNCARAYDKTFSVGDRAEYDSYNLSYTGIITAITAKTVTVKADHGSKVKRLSLHEFNWRNRHLDLEATARRNADTMLSI